MPRTKIACPLALLLAALLPLLGCASAQGPEPALTLEGIAPRYLPSFQALRASLEEQDLPTAEAVLRRLLERLDQEQEFGTPALAAEARSARELARGFERIVDGRQRLAALELRLELEPVAPAEDGAPLPPEHQSLRLFLVVSSTWPADLVLRPGPPNLALVRTRVTPLGNQSRLGRAQGLDPFELEVPAGGQARHELGRFGPSLTRDMLAERLVFELELRAGELRQGEQTYPAQGAQVDPVEYVALAAYLPNAALEPAELASYLERPGAAMPPVMERALRILPERRAEALELLEPLVDRATQGEFERLGRALAWLAPQGPRVGGREAWLRWLRSQ